MEPTELPPSSLNPQRFDSDDESICSVFSRADDHPETPRSDFGSEDGTEAHEGDSEIKEHDQDYHQSTACSSELEQTIDDATETLFHQFPEAIYTIEPNGVIDIRTSDDCVPETDDHMCTCIQMRSFGFVEDSLLAFELVHSHLAVGGYMHHVRLRWETRNDSRFNRGNSPLQQEFRPTLSESTIKKAGYTFCYSLSVRLHLDQLDVMIFLDREPGHIFREDTMLAVAIRDGYQKKELHIIADFEVWQKN